MPLKWQYYLSFYSISYQPYLQNRASRYEKNSHFLVADNPLFMEKKYTVGWAFDFVGEVGIS
jgi:hypothetical protein